MPALVQRVQRDNTASWFTPLPGQETKNIATEAYQKAVKHLKDELGIHEATVPLEHRATIEEINILVEEAKAKYEAKLKERGSVSNWLESFSSRVLYYGRVMDMLAQHHPEYVALAWGALKFVLMVGVQAWSDFYLEDLMVLCQGIINHADLVKKLSQALVEIGDVLPRAELSAELFPTKRMQAALSRLYTYIMLFFQLCVRWYKKSSLGRALSSVKRPFELDYKEVLEQVKRSSKIVEDIANAAARAEIRHIRAALELHHSQLAERDVARDARLHELQETVTRSDKSMLQLLQVATCHKSITERLSLDFRGANNRLYRIELHHVIRFLEPRTMPEAALLKVQSFVSRRRTLNTASRESPRMRQSLCQWASQNGSSLMIIQVSPGTQAEAKELAAGVITRLKTSTYCVFWNISLVSSIDSNASITEVLKSVIFQTLRHSQGLFSEFAEHLNLEKIHGQHNEREWADLLVLVFSKLPRCFVVIETEDLHRACQHDPTWAESFLRLFQSIVDRSTMRGGLLKVLLLMHCRVNQVLLDEPSESSLIKAALLPSILVPARLRHTVRRCGRTAQDWRYLKPGF